MIVPRRFFALVSFAGALALAGTVADAQDAPATPSPSPSPVATASAARRSVRLDPLHRQPSELRDGRLYGSNRSRRHRERLHEHRDDRPRRRQHRLVSAVVDSVRDLRPAPRFRGRADYRKSLVRRRRRECGPERSRHRRKIRTRLHVQRAMGNQRGRDDSDRRDAIQRRERTIHRKLQLGRIRSAPSSASPGRLASTPSAPITRRGSRNRTSPSRRRCSSAPRCPADHRKSARSTRILRKPARTLDRRVSSTSSTRATSGRTCSSTSSTASHRPR